MDEIFRFRPDFRVELPGDGRVFLVGEHERYLFQGIAHERVAALLDGRRTVAEIVDALEGAVSLPEVDYLIATLRRRGFLVEVEAGAEQGLSAEAAAFWHALGSDAALAAARLRATPVAVVALGGEDPAPLAEALAGVGAVVREEAALRLVVTGDYLARGLDVWNRRALAEGLRWMPVKPAGSVPWMGPLFRPGEGPCWECLAQRLRVNRPVETFLGERLGREEPVAPPRAALPTSARAAVDLTAFTVARWIVDGGRGVVDSRLLALDLRRMRLEEHAVVRRPQCPACGDPDLLKRRAERPVALEPRPKRFTDDGGYRAATPEETYARHEHLVSPITGVVTRVAPVEGRDHPLRPVFGAGFFVRATGELGPALGELHRATLGKGRTPAQSRTAALCEAIERYSAAAQGDEPIRRARLSELGGAAVHPHQLQHFSEAQYRRRDEWNSRIRDRRQRIPPPFDERVAIDWTPAWSLTTGERRYVPATYCWLGHEAPPEERFCDLDPNGHAAGNCLEEAILQAFFELSERDAVGIWWYGRVPRPAVDLASFEEPYFTALEEHYRAMGYRLWVLDVTTDLELPAFVALVHSEEKQRWCVGFGCHLEARLGVMRAITELNQLFDPAGTSRAPWGEAPLPDEAFLSPADSPPRRRGDFAGPPASDDLRADVEACVQRAAGLGLETLVVDQTRPDLGLSAIKLIVPGLRHFWPRLGPGRIQDVPVKLGWLPKGRAEEELNPVPLYL
jgi:bacteriocin biosynthesis cyclodehydratase domain-containing protein